MSVPEEQEAIWLVLQKLHSHGDDWTRHDRPTAAAVPAAVAVAKFTPISDSELSTKLLWEGKAGEFDENKVIYVVPPDRDRSAVAGIWCRWNFDRDLPKCGFYYGVWSSQPRFPAVEPPDADRFTAFVGYRFETPEQGDNHNYYHSQPCRGMGEKAAALEQALPVSHHVPTWPLAANSSLELLLCLVTSLYGMNGMVKLKTDLLAEPQGRNNTTLNAALSHVLAQQRQGG